MTKSTDSLTAAIYELRNSTCFCNRWIHQDVFYLLLSSTQSILPNLSAISIARLLPKLVIGLDGNTLPNNLGLFRQRKNSKNNKFFGYYITSTVNDTPTILHNWFHNMVTSMDENMSTRTRSTSHIVISKQLEQSVDDSICMTKNKAKQTVAPVQQKETLKSIIPDKECEYSQLLHKQSSTTNKTTVKTTKTVAIQCDQLSFHQNDSDRIIIARPLIDEVSGQQQKDTPSPQTTTTVTTTYNMIDNIIPFEDNTIELLSTTGISKNPLSEKTLNSLGLLNKWQSPEALFLFTGTVKNNKRRMMKSKLRKKRKIVHDFDIDVREDVKTKSDILKKAYLTSQGWRSIIDDNDSGNHCTPYERFVVQQKAKYLYVLMEQALEFYEDLTWKDICTNTLRIIDESNAGYAGTTTTYTCDDDENEEHEQDQDEYVNKKTEKEFAIKDPLTLMSWFRSFRCNSSFPNPASSRMGRKKIPLLFQNNPDIHEAFSNYVRQNLDTLSANSIHLFLFEKAFPEVIKKMNEEKEEGEDDMSLNRLLAESGLKCLTTATLHKWLVNLGFKYETQKKTYYVDSHEKPENVDYRSKFIDRYFGYEMRAHRWLSISKEESDKLIEEGEINESIGYEHIKIQIDGSILTFVEYHVDDHPQFIEQCANLKFGGNLSVRFPIGKKPLFIFGQDECIFKQYSFTKKAWVLPDGTRPLIPKDEGMGLMLSSFQSREFGYGLHLTDDDFRKINEEMRGESKFYSDLSASQIKNGKHWKPLLETSPFVMELEYGSNKDGYWTYDSMILQLEDCIDCMKCLYPEYDYVFLFDHSNGHDRLQPNGLSINKIRKNFGGKQSKMRKSKLTEKEFGPYHLPSYQLQPGMTQHMNFEPGDPGPFYLSESERENRRFDKPSGKTRKEYFKKDELIVALGRDGMKVSKGTTKVKCQKLCNDRGIAISYLVDGIIEGWVGKPKGSFQILYE